MLTLLTLDQVIERHERAIRDTGGSFGIRDRGALESAVAQPSMTAFGNDLYPTLAEKVAALTFSLIKNHAFVDGNKRTAFYCLEDTLAINGYELRVSDDEAINVMVDVARSVMSRESFVVWIEENLSPIED